MAFKYSVSSEYKTRGDYRYKQVKCNRKLYGEIREYPKLKTPDGRTVRVYLAVRLPGEFVLKHGAWAFDKLMFDRFRELGIPLTHIGVLVTSDTKRRAHVIEAVEEKYLIPKDDFFCNVMREADGGLIKWDYSRRGGSNQMLVHLTKFRKVVIEADEERLKRKHKEMIIRK